MAECVRGIGHKEAELFFCLCRKAVCCTVIAALEALIALLPDIAYVEMGGMQLPSRFDTIDNHACKGCYLTLWIMLHDMGHGTDAAVLVVQRETGQSTYKNELWPVGAVRVSSL